MRDRPKLLDAYCGAGGTGMGYHMAGFEVIGIDIKPQPNYPFRFIQADALKALASARFMSNFVSVHASPPCQGFTTLNALHRHVEREYLIDDTRELLEATRLPYIIENVQGAPLIDPVRLCGSSFGLRVRRHRLFESNVPLEAPPCAHAWQSAHRPYGIYHSNGRKHRNPLSGVVPLHGSGQLRGGNDIYHASVAMGIDWMTKRELNDAIPPVYTLHLRRQLIEHVA